MEIISNKMKTETQKKKNCKIKTNERIVAQWQRRYRPPTPPTPLLELVLTYWPPSFTPVMIIFQLFCPLPHIGPVCFFFLPPICFTPRFFLQQNIYIIFFVDLNKYFPSVFFWVFFVGSRGEMRQNHVLEYCG